MRIHLGTNYLGYERARAIEVALTAGGHEVIWYGAPEYDYNDDYPVYTIGAAKAVVEEEDSGVFARGIIVGATGAAEVIAANKVNGARAVGGASTELVRDARAHADANILVLGSIGELETDLGLIEVLLTEPFHNELDDARRIVNVNEFESSGTIEGWMVAFTSGSSGR